MNQAINIRRLTNLIFKATLLIGLGGAGRDVALLVWMLRLQRVCELLGINDAASASTSRSKIEDLVARFTRQVHFDSSVWESFALAPRFAAESSLLVEPPLGFQPLASPSGKTIIANIEKPQFKMFKAWDKLPHIADKASNSEAQGNRLYGLTNAQFSGRDVVKRLESGLTSLENAALGDAVLELSGYGLKPGKGRRIHVFTSICGGQGAGAVIFVLGCLAKLIEDARENYEIFLHVFPPGFHQAQDDAKKKDQMMRAISVALELQALRRGGPLELILPDGKLTLEARHTEELFNYLTLHPARASEGDLYEAFVSRVAETVINAELSPLAADLRSERSNAAELARMGF